MEMEIGNGIGNWKWSSNTEMIVNLMFAYGNLILAYSASLGLFSPGTLITYKPTHCLLLCFS